MVIFYKVIFANFFIGLASVIYLFSLFPQLYLNYKIKSTKGLSDVFILASLNAQFSYLVYSFIKNLPFAYKVVNPIYSLLLLILVLQRFYYSDNALRDKAILKIYLFNLFVLFFVLVLIFYGIVNIGGFLAWIPVGIGLYKKVPQMFKIYKTKSVYGFSLFFIILSLFSYAFETIAGVILNLPSPVLINGFRGFFVNLVFLLQFWIYKV